jgi:hypothetical protein
MHLQDSMTRLTAAAVVATVVAPILQALAVTTLLEQPHQPHQQPLVLQLNQENRILLLLFKSRDTTIF